jgi:hypothetical protein
MNRLANRPRDAVANTGPHRALVLAVISIVVGATTPFYYDAPATIAATASSVQARSGKFNAAFCLSGVCVFYG